jgi:hypothetical protein
LEEIAVAGVLSSVARTGFQGAIAGSSEEQAERERQVELEKSRAEWDEIDEQSRREAMDRPPPETVRAYQEVYGHDPKGWPPV